jgi:hypothetical protein
VRPGLDRLTRTVATARADGRREIRRRLGPDLTPERCDELDELLVTDPALGVARLVWLNAGATSASSDAAKSEVAKLAYLKGLEADITATKWIADAVRILLDHERLDLLLVYLPHLDYDHQRFGPQGRSRRRQRRSWTRSPATSWITRASAGTTSSWCPSTASRPPGDRSRSTAPCARPAC